MEESLAGVFSTGYINSVTVFHFKGVESSNKPTIMGASETKPQKSKAIFEIRHIKLRYLLSFDNNIKISILKRYLHYFFYFMSFRKSR